MSKPILARVPLLLVLLSLLAVSLSGCIVHEGRWHHYHHWR